MKNILFICTGNTCRSPMAEAIAKDAIKNMGLDKEYEASSAGIYAHAGDKASLQAVETMDTMGLNVANHCARQVDLNIIKGAYIILTMTAEHKRSIISMYPEGRDKVFSLKEYCDDKDGDIDDPYGRIVEVYKRCAHELGNYILKAINKLS